MPTKPQQQRNSTEKADFPQRTLEEIEVLFRKLRPENTSRDGTYLDGERRYKLLRALVAALREIGEDPNILYGWMESHMPLYEHSDIDVRSAIDCDEQVKPGFFYHLLRDEFGVDVPAQKPIGVLTLDEVKNPSGELFTGSIHNTSGKPFAVLCRLFHKFFPDMELWAIRARANDACHVVGHIRHLTKGRGRGFVDVKLVPDRRGRRNSLSDIMSLDTEPGMGRTRSRKYLTEILGVLVEEEVLERDGEGRYRLGPARWK
jgi:hypothetical protein